MKKRGGAKKRNFLKFAILVVVLAVIGAAVYLWFSMERKLDMKLGEHAYKVTVLRGAEETQKGLSGTESLPENELMLFDFEMDYRWGIWMKDMKYSIDVIWLDKDGKVVYVVKNMKPESYPGHYQPEEPSRYVIEGVSGTINKTGVKVGDVVTLPPEVKQ